MLKFVKHNLNPLITKKRGQFFDKFLKLITMNKNNIDWSKLNNDYLIKVNNQLSYL
jgi:hypothetical protein